MCVCVCVIVGWLPLGERQWSKLEKGRVWQRRVSITHRGHFDVGPLVGGQVLYEGGGGQVGAGEPVLRSQEKY